MIDGFYPSDNSLSGYCFPWTKTNENLQMRFNELSMWTGINGHGKSQLLGNVVLDVMRQGGRVCIASLELTPKKLLMRLTRQAGGVRQPSAEYIWAIHQWYQDRLWIFDLVGTAKTKRILEVFLYARQRYGIDVFVIDSLMKCGLGEDDYNGQKLFVEQLCDFKNEHDCHIHLVVHPRKGPNEMQIPGKMDIKGSGAITDLTDNCFSVFRNKEKEDKIQGLMAEKAIIPRSLDETFDCILGCDKQRNGEWEGRVPLWFHSDSFQFLGYSHEQPYQYVPYSICK